jgi:hypothetical protein
MKTSFALFAVLCAWAFGAESPAPNWQPELNVRLRVESRDQNFTFNSAVSSPTDGTWLLTRVRVGVKGKFSDALSLYAQAQDARELSSDRPGVPYILGSEGDDPLDLRQLYIDFKDADLTLRVGRQVLAFGDERLVGPVDWNNLARSFDAARVTWPKIGGGLDAFVGSVVQVQPTSSTGWHANHSSTDDLFAGVYSRFTAGDTLKLEPYVFWRQKKTDTLYSVAGAGTARPYDIPQKITTLGARWSGGPPEKLDGFDYDGEFAWQTGTVRGRVLGSGVFSIFPGPAWLDHNAWALHTGAGYTTKAPGFPLRFYGEFNYATGDKNPGDTSDESFLNLFPTNHKFYGGMDVFAWKNMREFALTAAATLSKQTKLRVEHHLFALANTNDAWFRANGVTAVRALTPATRTVSRDAGQETDLVLSHTLNARVAFDLGWSWFAAGRYLAQTGGASNAQFAYAQTVFQW